MISQIKTLLKTKLKSRPDAPSDGSENHRSTSCASEFGNPPAEHQIVNQLRDLKLSGQEAAFNGMLWSNAETLRHYLHSFRLENAPQSFIAQYVNDALPRFFHTLRFLPHTSGLKVLELGSNPYLFSILVKRFLDYDSHHANFFGKDIYDTTIDSGIQNIASQDFDEHYAFEYKTFNIELSEYPYPDETFDGVLFCEILEHLVIDPLTVFKRLRKIIRPGGWLLLTTPNAVRIQNVALMLAGSNFFDRYHPEFTVYGRHNREFTVEEVNEIIIQNGFEVLECLTLDRNDYSSPIIQKDNYEQPGLISYTKPEIEKWLKAANGSLAHRGDNIYALARRN